MHRWESNVKMNHKKKVVEDVVWMDLIENMGEWEALVNMKQHSKFNRRWCIAELPSDFQDTLMNSVEASVHTYGVFL